MKIPAIVSELYPFMAALEDALRNGFKPDDAFARAKAHYEKTTGQPCPFTVVRSCPSCRFFDRGVCHRWNGKTVPAEFVAIGCGEHAFVKPAPIDPSVPF